MMLKGYLDYLYEQRSKVQADFDKLIDKSNDRHQCCKDMDSTNPIALQIKATREHIYTINKCIEKYMELH